MTVSGLSLRRRLPLTLAGLGLTIQHDETTAHPVFEEIMAGDGTEAVGEVHTLLADARDAAGRIAARVRGGDDPAPAGEVARRPARRSRWPSTRASMR